MVDTQPLRNERADSTPVRATAPSHEAATQCTWELHGESGPAGTIAVLRVAGEIDMLTIPTVQHAVAAAMDQRPTDIVIDLSAVGFCCARGFALLAATAHTAHGGGTGFAVSGMTPHLDRVASMLSTERFYARYRSAAVAVTALRIDQTCRPA